jgi:hypothetical protein
MLWDRGEPDGSAWHMTDDPYRDTPRHTVLLHMAYGDHQVANVATEVEARTIGARLRTPALDPGRSPDREPFYAIPAIRRLPYRGSALVVWDIGPLRPPACWRAGQPLCEGTPPPPTTNTPPRLGRDPHGLTARETAAQLQYGEFLKIGGRSSTSAEPRRATRRAGPGAPARAGRNQSGPPEGPAPPFHHVPHSPWRSDRRRADRRLRPAFTPKS